jgi:uncharacterized membrane protein
MMQDTKGFFGSLFDLSFTSLVTTRIIKVLYVLAIVLIGLYALVFIAGGFSHSTSAGVVVLLIIAPIFALVSLIYTRVLLEVIIALFRIMENTSELVARADDAPSTVRVASGPRAPTSGQ